MPGERIRSGVPRSLLASLLALALWSACGAPALATYADVLPGRAAESIEVLAALGIVSGRDGGPFRPEDPVTRAELAKMAVLAFVEDPARSSSLDSLSKVPPRYYDVAFESWAKPYIEEASDAGLVTGYPDGSFRPDSPVTVLEALHVLWRVPALRGLEIAPDAEPPGRVPGWAAEAASWASRAGLLEGLSGPELTRAQAAVMVRRCLGLLQRDFDIGGVIRSISGQNLLVSLRSRTGQADAALSLDEGTRIYLNGSLAQAEDLEVLDEVEAIFRRDEDGRQAPAEGVEVLVARSAWAEGTAVALDHLWRTIVLGSPEVTVRGGKPESAALMTIAVPSNCEAFRNGRPASFGDLRVGDLVRAALSESAEDAAIARFIDAVKWDLEGEVSSLSLEENKMSITLPDGTAKMVPLDERCLWDSEGDVGPGDFVRLALDERGAAIYVRAR